MSQISDKVKAIMERLNDPTILFGREFKTLIMELGETPEDKTRLENITLQIHDHTIINSIMRRKLRKALPGVIWLLKRKGQL